MRLTFPVLTLSRGGAQRMITELANRLAEIGHEVVVLMPSLGIVEYEMKCPIIPVPAPVLTEDHFPTGMSLSPIIIQPFRLPSVPAGRAKAAYPAGLML